MGFIFRQHILPQLELWLLNVLLFRPGGLLNGSFRPLKGCYQLIFFSKNEYENSYCQV